MYVELGERARVRDFSHAFDRALSSPHGIVAAGTPGRKRHG